MAVPPTTPTPNPTTGLLGTPVTPPPVVQSSQIMQAHSLVAPQHHHHHHHHHHHQHQQYLHQMHQMMYMNPMVMGAYGMAQQAAVDPDEKAEDWKAYKTQDGKVYWGHKVKGTTWAEPDVVRAKRESDEKKKREAAHKPQGPAEAGWVLFKDEKGKSYYKNVNKGDVSYSLPPEVRKMRREKEEAKLAAIMAKAKEVEKHEEVAVAAVEQLPPQVVVPEAVSAASVTPEPAATTAPQHERIYDSKKERIEAFRKMLVELKIDPLSDWSDAMKLMIADERYSALKSMKDKHDTFKEYCDKSLKTRRDADRKEKKEAKTAFHTLLESKNLSGPIPYERGLALFSTEPSWKAVRSEIDRRRLFTEYMADLDYQLKEQRRASTILRVNEFGKLLPTDISLSKPPSFRDIDKDLPHTHQAYRALTEEERQYAYQEYLVHLENLKEVEKVKDAKQRRREERSLVAAFLAVLNCDVEKGKIHHLSRWKEYQGEVREEKAYADLSDAPGYRHDLFDMVVDEVGEKYAKGDKARLTQVVLKRKITDICKAVPADFEGLVPPVPLSSIKGFLAECAERVETREAILSRRISRLKSHIQKRPTALLTTKQDLLTSLQKDSLWTDLDSLDPTKIHRLGAIDEAVSELQEEETRKRKRDAGDDHDRRKRRDKERKRRRRGSS